VGRKRAFELQRHWTQSDNEILAAREKCSLRFDAMDARGDCDLMTFNIE
jgi:hypothetical protein